MVALPSWVKLLALMLALMLKFCNLNFISSKMVGGIHLIHLFKSIYSVPGTGDTDMSRANKDPADRKLTI